MKSKIQILMSTYNGEKYLEEQLNSIVNQKGNFDIKILIRDDGSIDKTIDIIGKYKNKIEIDIIKGKNIGVNESMKELFMNADVSFDYFAISDQDDVWNDNKLNLAVEQLEKTNFEGLKMFSSRSLVTDEKLNIIGKTQDSMGMITFYNAMIQNICPGHTQVFNKEVVLELRKNYCDKMIVIDWWIYMLVSAVGELTFYRECTVKHRQHRVNSVGYELNFIKKTLKRLKKIRFKEKSLVTLQLESFINIYCSKMSSEYSIEALKFLKNRKKLKKRLQYIMSSKSFRYGKFENFAYKILYLLGKYK